ncbi:OmpR/PhoB-type DNA-binding domain [Candidatus Pelagibacterales bacterium]
MGNINLVIFGSDTFSDIINELEINYIINKDLNLNKNKEGTQIRILFSDGMKYNEVKENLIENFPLILLCKSKDYIKRNNITLSSFHVPLTLPIDILSFVEIIKILYTKFIFFKKSKIIINDYEIDSNQRTISKKKIKVKLTEKELELILALKNNNGLNKSFLLKSIWKHSLDLDTHAFETHIHRLRKKIYKYFRDDSFIIEKKSLYYLAI